MSNRTNWRIAPWEWQDVPIAWQEWVLISLDIHSNLSTPSSGDATG